MKRAGEVLLKTGVENVLLKGGHLEGEMVFDVFMNQSGEEITFEQPKIRTRNTHGTGCTLASALACGIAKGLAPRLAVLTARDYVYKAIQNAPGDIGHGHGPLGH